MRSQIFGGTSYEILTQLRLVAEGNLFRNS